MSCNTLTADILKNCLPITGGIADDYIYLIPISQIDKASCTYNASNDLIIESIVLVSASPAYSLFKIQGQKFSNAKKQSFVKGASAPVFDHSMMIKIMNNDPDVKKRIEELAVDRYVVIAKNNYNNSGKAVTPSDSVYEVFFWELGGELGTAENDSENADLKNGWDISLICNDKHKEPRPAHTLYKTSLAVTDALITALL